MQEITAPLANLPDDPMPEVADVDFPVVLRGYDRVAVDAYVRRASQLVAELNAGRSPQAAVRRALERVGEEVSGILQRAHDTAEQITSRSRIEAEDRLESARREADALLTDARLQAEAQVTGAQQRLTDLDAETDRIWGERHRIVEDARGLAAQLLGLAEAAVERFPAADTGEHHVEEGPHAVEHPVGAEEDTGELTEPFDVEAEPGLLPEEEAAHQNTVPIDRLDPPDDDLLEHDAE